MNNRRPRVLITASGGDMGQSIVKALRLSARPIDCFGCDMEAGRKGIGSVFVDRFDSVPPAGADEFFSAITQLCEAWSVDAVIPSNEAEINVLSKVPTWPHLPCGTAIVSQRYEWIRSFGDKLACMQNLAERVPLVPFADGQDRQRLSDLTENVGFPVVVKERNSSGARGMRKVRNWSDLELALTQTRNPIVQQYIEDSGGEFSVGVFVHEQFESAIAFRRDLGPVGASWFAETSDDSEVIDYALQIARASGLNGSANIQVRKNTHGVRLLEINPRFSSLAAARALCGFRDVEWALSTVLDLPVIPPSEPFRKIRFRRFFHELVDIGNGYGAVTEWNPPLSTDVRIGASDEHFPDLDGQP